MNKILKKLEKIFKKLDKKGQNFVRWGGARAPPLNPSLVKGVIFLDEIERNSNSINSQFM